MNKKKKKARQRDLATARTAFVRGFVATGLLAAAEQDGWRVSRKTMRRAIKAGVAVASGTLVSEALQREDPLRTMVVLVAGATCLAITDRLLKDPDHQQEQTSHVEEKETIA